MAALHTGLIPLALDTVGKRFQTVFRNIPASLRLETPHALFKDSALLRHIEEVCDQHSLVTVSVIVTESDDADAKLVDLLSLPDHRIFDIIAQVERIVLDSIKDRPHTARDINAERNINIVGHSVIVLIKSFHSSSPL